MRSSFTFAVDGNKTWSQVWCPILFSMSLTHTQRALHRVCVNQGMRILRAVLRVLFTTRALDKSEDVGVTNILNPECTLGLPMRCLYQCFVYSPGWITLVFRARKKKNKYELKNKPRKKPSLCGNKNCYYHVKRKKSRAEAVWKVEPGYLEGHIL